jgi:hypothetical protein
MVFWLIGPAPSAALTQKQATAIVGGQAAANGMAFSEYNGISLIALSPPAGVTFDVPIVEGKQALKVIANALALIEDRSAFSKSQIERLKKAAPVTIVYDPRYPDKMSNLATIQVALFSPRYFKLLGSNGKGSPFLVIVSRHGIKWPLEELAAVMVHELVGHGIQHLNNRWSKMRLIDMECEAWLYEEMAYQDLKMDKFSNAMITFKKQLAKQCDSFLRYLRNNDPKGADLWQSLNPDVPKLLQHFGPYLKNQEDQPDQSIQRP